MSFNIGLTGIKAADADLRATGNNIANASTTGFKRSRAEFGDVYASSILGSGSNSTGSGVLLTDVAQQFTQGNISFSDSSLDLAINGGGFFIMSDDGDVSYTRAGMFSTNKEGFIVDNSGARLQGFGADSDGNIINGVLTDLQVQSGNQAPQPTAIVNSEFNLDATEVAPEELLVSADGSNVLLPSAAGTISTSISSVFAASAFDFNANNADMNFSVSGNAAFTVSFTGATVGAVGNNDALIDDATELVAVLNAAFTAPAPAPYDDFTAVDTSGVGTGPIEIRYTGTGAGNGTNFSVTYGGTGAAGLQSIISNISPGASSAFEVQDNGYNPGLLDVITATGTTTLDLSTVPGNNASAREIATEINLQNQLQNLGVSASAHTQVRLSDIGSTFASGELILALKPSAGGGATSFINLTTTGSTVQEIVNAINGANITGISAVQSVDGFGNPSVDVTAQNGEDIIIQNLGADPTDVVSIEGLTAAGSSLAPPANSAGALVLNIAEQRIIGGEVDVSVADGVTVLANAITPGNVWGSLPGNSSNTFDPLDPETYNSATSVTVYDSLGNSHIMTQYFVKERTDPLNTATTSNTWSMYVLIDGHDVGNPAAGSSLPGRAQFNMRFNSDGTLDPASDGPFLVTNWTPVDENGNFNGALGSNPAGTLPITSPATDSNFEIDIDGTTQFGSDFGVIAVTQNGFTTGRLTGLNIDDAGIIFARFTNGQAQVLGQVALGGFTNEGGLQPLGSTNWAETFESGTVVVGTPQSSALGAIQSGGLEDSNVDLSAELVKLIIAQRNYQSNAKTIETADQVTQTILNI